MALGRTLSTGHLSTVVGCEQAALELTETHFDDPPDKTQTKKSKVLVTTGNRVLSESER